MKLNRQTLIDFEKEWLSEHPNKNENPQEYESLLDGLVDIISKHEYEEDNRFVTYGRRDFLRKEFTKYLNEETFSGRGKFNDAFVDLADYYSGDTWISSTSVPKELDLVKIRKEDSEYREEGIICKQEKEIILEMIEEYRAKLNSLKDDNSTSIKGRR